MPLKKANPSNLKKASSSIVSCRLTKTPGTIIFASYPKKKIDRKYIDAFWERYFNGKLQEASNKRKDQSIISNSNTNLKFFFISPSVAITIRKVDLYYGKYYLKLNKYFKPKLQELKYSKVVFADIVDYKIKDNNYYIMERIIPSITINDIVKHKRNEVLSENRFMNSFLNTMEKIDPKILNKFYKDLGAASSELIHTFFKINLDGIHVDAGGGANTIIIDYNPITGKFKFGIIDLIVKIDSKSF